MPDSSILGIIITTVLAIVAMALLALDERNRGKFLARETFELEKDRLDESLREFSKKLDGLVNLFSALEDKTSMIETRQEVLEERQTQQWERVSENMRHTARTVEAASKRLEEVTKMVNDVYREVQSARR